MKIVPVDVKFRHYRLELFSRKISFLRLKDVLKDVEDLRRIIISGVPKNAYFTPVKWLNPIYTGKTKSELDVMLSSPLFFDIDMKLLTQPTFSETRTNTINLVDFLERRYGRSPDLIVFSGNQGFHVHYWDWDSEQLIRLTPRERIREFKKRGIKILDELRRRKIVVDETVTGDPYRLLKIPYTLHGTSGLIAKPVNDLYSFRPEKDGLAFDKKVYDEILQIDLDRFQE